MEILEYVDIGCNLTDPQYRGVYRDKQKHKEDLLTVLKRGADVGVTRMVITCGIEEDIVAARTLANSCESPKLAYTCGVHPTRVLALEKEPKMLERMKGCRVILHYDYCQSHNAL